MFRTRMMLPTMTMMRISAEEITLMSKIAMLLPLGAVEDLEEKEVTEPMLTSKTPILPVSLTCLKNT